MDDDPYKILCLDRKFTLDQLRRNYKRLALQLHPDKCRLDVDTATNIFQILTRAYKKLLHEYETQRVADKTFDELKAPYVDPSAPADNDQHDEQRRRQPVSSKNFDPEKFNAFFAQHRMKLPEDEGYSTWISESSSSTSSNIESRRDIIKHSHPEPVNIVKSIAYLELGVDRIDDFSKPPSSTDRRNALQFTDYRIAHTTSKLVDGSQVKQRRAYRNVRELEAERAKEVRLQMTPAEAQMHAILARRQEDMEERRVQTLRRMDAEATATASQRSSFLS